MRESYENRKSYKISGHYLRKLTYSFYTIHRKENPETTRKINQGKNEKGVNINCKKTEYVVLRKKKDRKWSIETQRHIRMKTLDFQILIQILRLTKSRSYKDYSVIVYQPCSNLFAHNFMLYFNNTSQEMKWGLIKLDRVP